MAGQPQSVEHLLGAALDCTPEHRAAFLDRVCAGAPDLRRRIDELLLAAQRGGSSSAAPSDLTSETVPISGAPAARAAIAEDTGRFAPGQVIAGRFTIVRFIAHGGMGEVYEVEDGYLQSVHVALKVIRPEIAADASSSHRFEQEVLLARKVTHPNLCPIYDISLCRDPAPPFLFLTMKLLPGETLAARLRRSRLLPAEEAVSIFRQMIAGVAAIHAAGVIHRDIKPNNVMLDQAGAETAISIMDFGLARLHESEATVIAAGFIAGTPGYLAPELYLGQRPSQATDIFALGVLLHEVLTGVSPSSSEGGLPVEPSLALARADVPPALMHAVAEFLSADPARRCVAFAGLQAHSRDFASAPVSAAAVLAAAALAVSTPSLAAPVLPPRPLVTRRTFALGSALAAGAVAAGSLWKRDQLEDWLAPLPGKRFVALLTWPAPVASLKPMLLGVIDAIASELSRAEAFDHDFFVTAQKTSGDLTTHAQLSEVRDSLGSNLILAASGVPQQKELHLTLRVYDGSFDRPLREKEIRVPLDQQTSLPERAVRAAARLLNVSHYSSDDQRTRPGTNSLEAFAAFQAAEAFVRQPNDTGIDAAIEKYKQAVELDPHYARAYARLARAYCRFYVLHGDAAAISLARANAQSALAADPNSVEAHVAIAWIEQETGDQEGAAREIAKALALDPSNSSTLTYQARFYAATGQWTRAEATLNRVLSMRPNDWLAHNELGVMLNLQGKYPGAALEFRAASLANPNNALAFANLGANYLQQGKLADALLSAQKSFALSQNETAAATMAEVYRVQHKYAEAISFAEKATRLAPAGADDWLELADCYGSSKTHRADALGAYARALHVQEEQLDTEPKNGPAWMLLALLRIKTGRKDTAAPLVSKAELLQADDLSSQLYKVRVLALLGASTEALSAMARCLQRGATAFQLQTMPDLEPLQADPRYRELLKSGTSETAETL